MLRNALKYVLECDGLDVFATAETLEMAVEVTGGKLETTFRPHVISDLAEFSVGDQQWRCSRTDHPVETMGLRVDAGGRSLGYTADTGPAWSLAELGPVDLGLSEATFLHDSPERNPVHLSAHQAGALARAAGVRPPGDHPRAADRLARGVRGRGGRRLWCARRRRHPAPNLRRLRRRDHHETRRPRPGRTAPLRLRAGLHRLRPRFGARHLR